MNFRKGFVWIWRVNAIVILVGGLLGCVGAAFVVRELWSEWRTPPRVQNVARVTVESEPSGQVGELGYFKKIAGTEVLRAPLELREEIPRMGSYSKEASSTHNFFYLNPTTRAGHWLRKPFGGIILDVEDVSSPLKADEKDRVVVLASLYEIVPEDSNKDGRLTASDIQQIGLSAPDGTGFRILVEQADRMRQVTLLDSGRVLVLYTLGGKLSAVEFDPALPDSPPARYEISTEFPK